MKYKLVKYGLGIFIICIICETALCSGWNDYDTKLPNGYRLVRTNAPSIFIFHPEKSNSYENEESCIVPPKIIRLNIYKEIVFGITEHSPDADDWGPVTPGFFILDTKNHKVQLGLDKDTWLSSLKAFGIKKEPLLRKPSRFVMFKIYIGKSFKFWLITICILLIILIAHDMWKKSHKLNKPPTESYEKSTSQQK